MMLSDFLTWWAEQMLQWVPARWIERDRIAANALIIMLDDTSADGLDWTWRSVAAVLRRKGRDRALGVFDLDGPGLRALRGALPQHVRPAIILRLPPSLLLEREVVLPLAAEREPERVLAYEMDRLTPFANDEVFWTQTIERRDRVRKRLHVRLSVVTRAAIQPQLAALGQAGLGPTVLEIAQADNGPRRIALAHAPSGKARLERAGVAVAAAACGTLALLAVALPFILQSNASRKVEGRIEALQPRVSEAEALRRRIAASTTGIDVVAAERMHAGDALVVLAAVTTALPDDTFLTDLALQQGKLTINGQSGAAVRLIAMLSGSPLIHNPEFVAPVTRIENGHADLFAIRAAVVP